MKICTYFCLPLHTFWTKMRCRNETLKNGSVLMGRKTDKMHLQPKKSWFLSENLFFFVDHLLDLCEVDVL